MTRPCLEWGALLSIERPAMELRADASRHQHCTQPSTSACPTFPRATDAPLTRGRVQRRVEWDALVPAWALSFRLVLDALTGSFKLAAPFYVAFVMSTCVRLRCPQTCDSGSRCGCVALRHRWCTLSADPVACAHNATLAHLRQGHARPHHSCGGGYVYAYAARRRGTAGNASQLVWMRGKGQLQFTD